MKKGITVRGYVAGALCMLAVALVVLSADFGKLPGDASALASRLGKRLERQLDILEAHMAASLEGDAHLWMDDSSLPEDMVIYRYAGDSLQSWRHQFPVKNDDISFKVMYPRLTNPRMEVTSPLLSAGPGPSFMGMGPKWYVVQTLTAGEITVIGGICVPDALRRNPREMRYSIHPVSSGDGPAVCCDGVPLFKVEAERIPSTMVADVPLMWFALVLLIAALLILLSERRELDRMLWIWGTITVLILSFFLWGRTLRDSATIFSPILYADGPMLYSLGAVILINLELSVCQLCLFLTRNRVRRKAVLNFAASALALGIWIYSFFALRSIVLNSNIELEIYKLSLLSAHTAVVFASFLPMMAMVPLLLFIFQPFLNLRLGTKLNPLSVRGRALYSVILGAYLVALAALFGFRKEESRMEMWSARLAIDRDISLELQLRSVENAISEDSILGALAVTGNTGIILNRITELYLSKVSQQSYDLSAMILDQDSPSSAVSVYNDRVSHGTPIFEGSRFLFGETGKGTARYSGLFSFFSRQDGVHHILLEIEPKAGTNEHGYSTIFGVASPGKVTLPPSFTYARYRDGVLAVSGGGFSYPTRFDDSLPSHYASDGRMHFVTRISPAEVVVISRPKVNIAIIFIAVVFLALLSFLLLMIPSAGRRRASAFGKDYYRSRVTYVVVISLSVTLISMAAVSVLFVYHRNEKNLQSMMSDKITSLQAMVGSRVSHVNDFNELNTPEFTSAIEQLSEMAKLDITLYTPSGKAFLTTAPDVFSRMLVGGRMDGDAFERIFYHSRRYYIHKEKAGRRRYYAMYAPVFNSDGTTVAVIGSPFIPEIYEFGRDAVIHSATVVMVFIILLILSRFMVTALVDRMFKPLVMMGRRMDATNVGALEYISYDRDDEISSLVKSYNRMVSDLSESTRQLAQAERDKAWSAMARQVAHEIKNPLTPMKLQLQRIIRLKAKGDPSWQDKFDEMARVMLYHIDVLSDTANEFSTFAKLYTEEHTDICLDALLKEEMSMFDNKDNIEFTYIGLDGITVRGPKPQLTRVFVNLMANAVQAIEIGQSETEGEVEKGQVMVSLRKGSVEGSYDIVFEDNGPGVPEENRTKLFTPNFTTKNSGTGLGLAISRSILESCGATISYSKSFTLGGACFTIRYPAK